MILLARQVFTLEPHCDIIGLYYDDSVLVLKTMNELQVSTRTSMPACGNVSGTVSFIIGYKKVNSSMQNILLMGLYFSCIVLTSI